MTLSLHAPDPQTGRSLPTGREIQSLLRRVFRRQGGEVLSAFRQNPDALPPDPRRWDGPMSELILGTGYFQRLFRVGVRQARLQLAGEAMRRARAKAFGYRLLGMRRGGVAVEIWRKDLGDPGESFGVFNARILEAVRRLVFDFCAETNATSTMKLADAYNALRAGLAQGLAAGEAQRQLVQRVREVFNDPYRSWRIAVTECVPGDTLLLGANVTGAYRRWYMGPMMQVVTESGLQLTGTPNHPMLTARGWVLLSQLKETDYLVSDGHRIKQLIPRPLVVSGNVDVEAPPPTFGEVFDSLTTVGVRSRQRTGKPDFHGDGLDGDVDVLAADRTLRHGRLASREQLCEQFLFSPADIMGSCLIPGGEAFVLGLEVDQASCFGRSPQGDAVLLQDSLQAVSVGLECAAKLAETLAGQVSEDDFFFRQATPENASVAASHLGLDGLRQAPRDAGFSAGVLNGGRMAAHHLGHDDRTIAGFVKFDRVAFLFRTEKWSGHVFNLETEDGYYNANGLYTKNSSRAVHAGDLMLLKDAGVQTKRWLASSDACDRCQELNGVEVGIDEPFAVVSGRGPYSVVLHPPLHPSCMCSHVAVL